MNPAGHGVHDIQNRIFEFAMTASAKIISQDLEHMVSIGALI